MDTIRLALFSRAIRSLLGGTLRLLSHMSPPESEPGVMVPAPAAAAAAAAAASATATGATGAAAAGGCGQQQGRKSRSKTRAITVSVSSGNNGWDGEATVAMVERLHDDMRALCAVST